MRMTRLATVIATTALVLSGCGTSDVADDAEVTVSGSLALPDGAPAAEVAVTLLKRPSPGTLFEVAATVASLGTLCLTQRVSICQGAHTTTTDPAGDYSFTLRGEDTKTFFDNPADFLLAAELPAGDGQVAGAGVEVEFKIDRTEVDVPALTFWQPRLTVEAGPQWVSYVGAGFDRAGRPEYTVFATGGEHVVWRQPGEPAGRFDARAIADLHGAVHITATTRAEADGIAFTTSYHSPRIGVTGVAGPPLSRGTRCAVTGPGPGSVATPIDPCPVTDAGYAGTLAQQWCRRASPATPTPSGSPNRSCDVDRWLQVDLATRQPLGALFLHALRHSADPVIVEASDDGTHWATLVTGRLSSYDQVDLPAGTAARYVRLRVDDGGDLHGLAELSLWP